MVALELADHLSKQTTWTPTPQQQKTSHKSTATTKTNTPPTSQVILIASATDPSEVHPALRYLVPLAKYLPLKLLMHIADKSPGLLAEMYAKQQPQFIKTSCLAINRWHYQGTVTTKRIHGKRDRIIPANPKLIDAKLNGGHLLTITHAKACLSIIKRWHPTLCLPIE